MADLKWHLTELAALPPSLLTAKIADLQDLLGGPTLIRLEGRRSAPLFISALLHGDEHTGFLALQQWLNESQGKPLPRRLIILLGNLAAAAKNIRRLPDQPDFNRVWRNPPEVASALVSRVMEIAREETLFAAVDIHNNSGKNPLYACVSHWEHRHLHLGALFGRTIVHSGTDPSTLTHAFSDFAPAVTLECGLSGDPAGIERAKTVLDACAHLSQYPSHPACPRDIDGYRTFARIRVKENVPFAFTTDPHADAAEIIFRGDLDSFNFCRIPAGTEWGEVRGDVSNLLVQDEGDNSVSVFEVSQGKLRNTISVIPAMLTVRHRAVVQDCLGYLMESVPIPT